MSNLNTIYFEKAVELGNMIRESEASKRLADAKAVFEADETAVSDYAKFKEQTEALQIVRTSGYLNDKNYSDALSQSVSLEIKLKSQQVVQEYIKAEEDYNNFVFSIVDVIKQTVGLSAHGCGGCGSHR